MRRMFLKRSLRRSGGQFVIVGLLVAIASAMLHLAAVLILQYPATLDDATAKLNTEHIFILLENEKGARDAERIAREDGRVKDHILLETLRAGATFEYDGKEQISAVTIVEQDKDTRIGRSGVVAEDSKRHADPIWLPYSFKTAGGYELGDPFAMTVRRSQTSVSHSGIPRESCERRAGLDPGRVSGEGLRGRRFGVGSGNEPRLAAEGAR